MNYLEAINDFRVRFVEHHVETLNAINSTSIQVSRLSSESRLCSTSTVQSAEELATILKDASGTDTHPEIWIEMESLAQLDAVAAAVQMPPLAARYFDDHSARTTFNVLCEGTVVMTFIAIDNKNGHRMEGESLHARDAAFLTVASRHLSSRDHRLRAIKMCVYISKNVVVTYEWELFPAAKGERPHNGVISARVREHLAQVNSMLNSLGAGFLVYLVFSEMVRSTSNVVGLTGKLIASLQRDVERQKLTNPARVKILQDLHVLHDSLPILKRFINKPFSNLVTTEAAVSSEGDDADDSSQSFHPLFREDLAPYWRDAIGVVKCIHRSIEAQVETTSHLQDNLTVVADLRIQQVNTTLSLVATIFLPLTFLTGVFGMNFQYDEKYPYGLSVLNNEYGAIYFWAMASCFVIFACCMFHYRGWTDALIQDQLAWG